MSIIKKVKLWWRSITPTEKILTILSGISTAAAVTGAVCAVKTYTEMEDKLSVEVKLYPNGKDDPNPKTLIGYQEGTEEADNFLNSEKTEHPIEKLVANTNSEKWEVWNPEWEPINKSESGYESVRLADALNVLLKDPCLMTQEDIEEAEARVEDLARQFAYLEGSEDDFRARFPQLKDHVGDIYENVAEAEKKGE